MILEEVQNKNSKAKIAIYDYFFMPEIFNSSLYENLKKNFLTFPIYLLQTPFYSCAFFARQYKMTPLHVVANSEEQIPNAIKLLKNLLALGEDTEQQDQI